MPCFGGAGGGFVVDVGVSAAGGNKDIIVGDVAGTLLFIGCRLLALLLSTVVVVQGSDVGCA